MKVVIKDVPGVDGEYESIGLDEFTMGEWRRVKKLTGLRAGEFEEAGKAGDMDALYALAIISLERAGKEHAEKFLDGAKPGSIMLVDEEEDEVGEERPPDSPTETGTSSAPADVGSEKSENGSSGNGSTTDGEESEPTLALTGSIHSDIGATSVSVT